MEDKHNVCHDEGETYNAPKASKFRLKSEPKRTSKRHRRDGKDEESKDGNSSKRHRSEDRSPSRRSHRDSKRRHKHRSSGKTVHDYTFTRSGEYQDPDNRHRESLFDGLDNEAQASPGANALPPDEAFRESLFDALADDEGAAYWEGVYGQPIHVYSNSKPGPDGKLERMGEEEYAEYVRAKMWEKSHEYIVEEREARAKRRKQESKQRSQMEEEFARADREREDIRRQMRESLKRGEERKRAKGLEASWSRYVKKWEDLKAHNDLAQETTAQIQEIIPWPVASGRWSSVSKDSIEYFFENSSAWEDDAAAMLKVERVRWHPDKMQQRFGQYIGPETMQSVTAVFQVVDRLWNERRK